MRKIENFLVLEVDENKVNCLECIQFQQVFLNNYLLSLFYFLTIDVQAHIQTLKSQYEKEKKMKEDAQLSANAVSSEVRSEMERTLTRHKTEHEETMKVTLERLKIESKSFFQSLYHV